MKTLWIALSLFVCAGCATAQTDALKVVKTDAGEISGAINPDGTVHAFKGIPFAAPPVGDLRWKAPQPVTPWAGVKACTAFGPSPVQVTPNPFGVYTEEFLIAKQPISEDCLYLNVWTGAKSATEKRPVLVWIYGGGFVSGGTNVPIYDGEALAKKGVILVSIPYRVGILGFLAHPELTKESPNHASGNYGIMDLIAALKWVKGNIANFGGDADNVTIAGQSAGSFNVNYLVASPLAKGLFKRAVAESGANFVTGPLGSPTLAQAEKDGIAAAQKLGAESLADLRKLTPEQLLKQNSFRPVVDGYVLPQSVAEIFAAGKENRVDLLTGWNDDDAFVGTPKNAADYKADIEKRYGEKASEMLKYYPYASDAEAEKSQINISRDMMFGVQNYTWANVQASKGNKVYLYRFARKMPATEAFKKYGAFHTGEVPYVFDDLKFVNRPFEPVDQQVANTVSSYWVNFARTGDPNGAGLPQWPLYKINDKQVMVLDATSAAKPLPDAAALDFMVRQLSGK